ncbi:DUF6456 domain-containing protein [Oricola thermophila]|uniref:DUF6456 domain-containing protein n=1 Tax=Oricola thermophila TaxID=2742145 RepID=A0A6N1VHN8_9HYPH|nr:DUF6456 domain-containing protein [Oricola thermophila]QKV18669.1 hypothetical protein HTY61_09520 [Oricola thermophila]
MLHETRDPGTLLTEFPDGRRLRLARGDLEQMRADGLVAIRERDGVLTIALSAEGRAVLQRDSGGDMAGQHRLLRQVKPEPGGESGAVTVNDAESPLASLARLRRPDGSPWLGRAEISAGERLRTDFERAMLQPRVTAAWDPSHVASARKGAGHDRQPLPDTALAARRRVNAAIDAVGPELAGVLLDVCCFLKGLEQVERERGWPRRSAKLMLRTALALLDRHYHPAPVRRSAGIRHWGAEGYRPPLRAS